MRALRDMSRVLAIAGLCVNLSVSQNRIEQIHFAAYPPEKVSASSIIWKQHFGSRKEEPRNLYSLMTQGAFRAPTADNIQDSINSWLQKHPNAEATVVYRLQPVMSDMPDSTMKSVWVTSGEDSLNVYLVSIGALPGGTMLLNTNDETSVTRQEYEIYLKRVIDAEELAKKGKLGIWALKSSQPEEI